MDGTQKQVQGHFRGADAQIHISPNGLQASLEVRGGFDPRIDYDFVVKLLDESGIIYGVDLSAVKKAVEAYHSGEKSHSMSAILARGTAPIPTVDARIEILVPPPPPVVIEEDGHADYRSVQKFRVVKEGDILARKYPLIKGKSGYDVTGKEIHPGDGHDVQLKAGKNVRFDAVKNEYIASLSGIFSEMDGGIEINPVLSIDGNVGLESGNIYYDGAVEIAGNVERGSMLSALGDVVVGGMVESGSLRISGSLSVRSGINTKHDGSIQVSGSLSCVYIDNSDVTVEGSILVEKSIMASRIVCYSDIELRGKHSTIAGGDIISFGSISADIIGSKAGTPTTIHLGVHHKNMQYYDIHEKELETLEKQYARKIEDIQKIKLYVQSRRNQIPDEKRAQFRVVFNEYKELTQLVERVRNDIAQLKLSRYNGEEVRIKIRNIMYPGVEIHYRGAVERIEKPEQSCILRFHPEMPSPVRESAV